MAGSRVADVQTLNTKNHRHILEKHLLPRFGDYAIVDVTRQEVQAGAGRPHRVDRRARTPRGKEAFVTRPVAPSHPAPSHVAPSHVAPPPALAVRGLSKRFGSLEVTRNVSFLLEEGARCALIGPNGAGKTTFINLISGRLKPSEGEIWIGGRNVTAMPEAARVKAGVGRTFQITSLFRTLTIEENLALAVTEHLGVAWRLRPNRAVRARVDARVAEILAMLRLEHEPRRPVEVLPYGVQRMVELGVALALEPKILLLDEPAAGVPRAEVGIIFDAIEKLPTSMAVLLIEHDIDVVFRFARRVAVLVSGEILVQGTPGEISEHAQVRALYLGDSGRESGGESGHA